MVKIIERIVYQNDGTLEKTTRKIGIPGKIVGRNMLAGVLNIEGWRLVMKDKKHQTDIIIAGDNEADMLQLKALLEKTDISVSILVNLKLPPGSLLEPEDDED